MTEDKKETPEEKALREFFENFKNDVAKLNQVSATKEAIIEEKKGQTTTTPARNLQAENVRNEIATQKASGNYREADDPRFRGFIVDGDAVRINPQTREVWNRDASSNLWSTNGFKVGAREWPSVQANAKAGKLEIIGGPAPATAAPGLGRAATTPTVGAPRDLPTTGAFFPNQAAFDTAKVAVPGGYLPGNLVSLDRNLGKIDPETGRMPNSFTDKTPNSYNEMTRGGPGRAGFTAMAKALDSTIGNKQAFGGLPGNRHPAPYSPNLFRDSTLLLDAEYGGPSGRDYYSRGEPSVATTYGGGAATLSPGTAGAEIRGGARGGIGLDSGAILGAHGIAPSGDPMVDAARAVEIAADMGLYDNSGPSAGAWTGDSTDVPAFARGGIVGTSEQLEFRNRGPAMGPQTAHYDAELGRNVVDPNPAWAPSPTAYKPQQQDFQADVMNRRRSKLGLTSLRAIQLTPGEQPTQPPPPGYYYRSYDITGEERAGQMDVYKQQREADQQFENDVKTYGFRGGNADLENVLMPGARQPVHNAVDWYRTRVPAYARGFAYGGDVSVMPQGGGRKSMVVSEPSMIVGTQTGTPYGIMGEAGAEVLTDVGNRLRIDPMTQPQPQSFRSPLALGIATAAANGLKTWR